MDANALTFAQVRGGFFFTRHQEHAISRPAAVAVPAVLYQALYQAPEHPPEPPKEAESVTEPQIPSGEVMFDLKAAVEMLIDPVNELEAVLVLAMARKPDGDVENRVYTVPRLHRPPGRA